MGMIATTMMMMMVVVAAVMCIPQNHKSCGGQGKCMQLIPPDEKMAQLALVA